MHKPQRLIVQSLFALFLCGTAQSDQLLMRNGDSLTGRVVKQSEDTLVFRTGYAGDLKIRWADVATLTTDEPVTVLLKDDTLRQAQAFAAEPGPDGVDIDTVSHINPPAELTGSGYTISGRVSVGANQTTGNTESRNLRLEVESELRARRHRISLGTIYNRASNSGLTSVDNLSLSAKYDRFLSEDWYVYGLTKFQRDRFRDLRLRRDIGLGVGHAYIAEEDRKLDLELGLTQLSEDFYLAPDQQGLSLRWAAKFQQRLYKDLLTLFHDHELVIPTERAGNAFVTTRTGLRVPVAERLTTTVQVNLDYDNAPSAGKSHTDQTYLFTLGYDW